MKKITLILLTLVTLFLLSPKKIFAQNLGTVEATEGVIVGNNTGTVAGTIRWTGTDFEGFDGTQWISLSNGNASLWTLNGNGDEIYYTADKVGIGIVDPDTDLHVDGGVQIIRGANGSNLQLEIVEKGNGLGGIFFKNDNVTTTNNWSLLGGNEPATENKMGWFKNGNERVVYHNEINNDTDGGLKIGAGNPQEKLDVDGAIIIGDAANANAGTIRWTGSDFEGYDGSQWVSLTPTSGGGTITAVNAGKGLTGGGTSGSVTLTAAAGNGLNSNAIDDQIQLGGTLSKNTLISLAFQDLKFNLNGAGEYLIDHGGLLKFAVLDNGRVTVGGNGNAGDFNVNGTSFITDDLTLRDGSMSGANLVKISDSADDGIIDVYQAGGLSARIHGNGKSYINGGNLGIGTANPNQKLHVLGTGRFSNLAGTGTRMVVADPNGDLMTQALPSGGGSDIQDTDGDTRIETEQNADEDQLRFTVDGTEFGSMDGKTFHLEAPGESLFIGKDAGQNDNGTFNYNTAIGSMALTINVAGISNTAVGHSALSSSTTGNSNVAVGRDALKANTSGGSNTALGTRALQSNLSGAENIAIGTAALNTNTIGTDNVSIGPLSMYYNTTGKENVAVGERALFENISGENNTAVGRRAMYNNTTGNYNIGIGSSALYSNTTGFNNTAIGASALVTNTIGSRNTAVGRLALFKNTSGNNNAALGSGALEENTTGFNNTAVGNNALHENTTGNFNSALGEAALYNNTSGTDNTALGFETLESNTIGNQNTAIGHSALQLNLTGNSNTAIGFHSLNNSRGDLNTAVGVSSMSSNNTGHSNTAIGFETLKLNSNGVYNVAIGYEALRNSVSDSCNVAVGMGALKSNSKDGLTAIGHNALNSNGSGEYNVAVGYESLKTNSFGNSNSALGYKALTANYDGTNNTAIGDRALEKNNGTFASSNTAVGAHSLNENTEGAGNTSVGSYSLADNTLGNTNSAFGTQSLRNNTEGSHNIAVGYQTLDTNTTGDSNTAIGRGALDSNFGGDLNCAIGDFALASNSSGNSNVAIGENSMEHNVSGNSNTALGRNSGPSSANTALFNSTALGYASTTTANHQVRIGASFVNSIGGYQLWTNLSDGRFKTQVVEDIPGLDFINQLRPVSYEINHSAMRDFLNQENVENENRASQINTGFIAQEVEQIAEQMGFNFSGVDAPKNDNDYYGLRYSAFVVPLTKAVQELSEQNQSLQESNTQLSAENEMIKEELRKMNEKIDRLAGLNE